MIDLGILRQFPLFQDLDTKEIREMEPLFQKREYNKDEYVFFEGDAGDECYIIQEGLVKISRIQETREIILSIFHAGEFFGEMVLLGNEKLRSATASTMEKTTLYVLNIVNFERILQQNPRILLKILQTSLQRLRQANELITDLTITNARTRLARLLLRLAESNPKSAETPIIHIKLTHQQMADMSGTVRETVSKVLSEFQSEQFIRIVKKQIVILNLDGLERIAGRIL